MPLVLLALGFACLWKGGEFVLEGAKKLASVLHVPPFLIGLTLVAFGTSAPEVFVNVMAVLQNKPDMVFGNVLGSNISNTLLILGVTGLIAPVVIKRELVKREVPFGFFSILLLTFTLYFPIFLGFRDFFLGKIGASILMVAFVGFFGYLFYVSKPEETPDVTHSKRSLLLSGGIFIVGLIGLQLGAKFVVDSASVLARQFDVSEGFVSLFIIALGTSLPELFASILAARNKQTDLAMGNIIGSNIFNILFVLGISAWIQNLPFNRMFAFDLAVVFASSALMVVFIFTGKRYQIERFEAFLLLVGYITYIGVISLRG